MKTKIYMNVDLKKILKQIAIEFKLDLLIVFGSYAKGTQNKNSDLDIAYISSKKIDEVELNWQIIQKINIEEIDINEIRNNNSFVFNEQIFRHGKLIFEKKEGIFYKLLNRSYLNYQDSKFLRETKNRVLTKIVDSIDTTNYKKKLTF